MTTSKYNVRHLLAKAFVIRHSSFELPLVRRSPFVISAVPIRLHWNIESSLDKIASIYALPGKPRDASSRERRTQSKDRGLQKLEEDLIAKRVFEKARGYLTMWITLGGVILTLATFVGYQSIIGYFTKLAKEKADAFGEKEMHKMLGDSVGEKVEARLKEWKPEILELVRQRVSQTAEPLAGASNATPASSPLGTTAQADKTLVDWAGDMTAPRDSGSEGSVVGQALAATLEFYVFKRTGSHIVISARDIYNETRADAGMFPDDSGAFIKDGIEFLRKKGAVEERAWPYRAGEFAQKPPATLAQEKRYKITDAKPIVTLDDLKKALQTGPVVTGITLYSSFESADVAKTGVVPMPKPKEAIMGAMRYVSSATTKRRSCSSSRIAGASSGDHGYGYLPYDYFRQESSDCWAFRYAGN